MKRSGRPSRLMSAAIASVNATLNVRFLPKVPSPLPAASVPYAVSTSGWPSPVKSATTRS
jgi:hypothetical protein